MNNIQQAEKRLGYWEPRFLPSVATGLVEERGEGGGGHSSFLFRSLGESPPYFTTFSCGADSLSRGRARLWPFHLLVLLVFLFLEGKLGDTPYTAWSLSGFSVMPTACDADRYCHKY